MGGFIDDKGMKSRDREEVQKGADASSSYHENSGQKVEPSKSCAWCTDRKARDEVDKMILAGVQVDWADKDKVLGVEHQYVEAEERSIEKIRATAAGEAAERLKRLPLGWELKDRLAGSAVVSKYVYGAENHGAPKKETSRLQRQVELAVRGPLHQGRARELLWTLILKGERSDPEQVLVIQAFQTFVRILQKRPETWEAFMRIWEKKDRWKSQTMARVPMQRLGQIMEK